MIYGILTSVPKPSLIVK